MSQSTLQSAFETGAVKFNLAESDYILSFGAMASIAMRS